LEFLSSPPTTNSKPFYSPTNLSDDEKLQVIYKRANKYKNNEKKVYKVKKKLLFV